MKSLSSILFAIIFLISTNNLFCATDSSYVEFKVTAEKNYQAIKLVLKLSVEIENKNFSVASEKCNVIINSLKSQLDPLISKTNIEFNIHNYNTFPVSSFFSDYFKVYANMDLILKDKEALGMVLDIIKRFEEIKIKSTSFIYLDNNEIKNDLTREIGVITAKKVKVLEENFNIRLALISISESNYSNSQNRSDGLNNLVGLSAGYYDKIGSRSNETSMEVLDLYPEQKFSYTLYFKYKIVQ